MDGWMHRKLRDPRNHHIQTCLLSAQWLQPKSLWERMSPETLVPSPAYSNGHAFHRLQHEV